MIYRREIDGLRAIAVLPVILFHGGLPSFSGGFVGVDVFFVISGYLITSIILAEKVAGTFSLRRFYERRARRILPALFLVMLACLPLAWLILLPSDLQAFSESLAAVAVFASNILFFRQSGYFDAAAELKPLLHTWSLAVEEQYYLFFPIFMLLTWRLGLRWIVGALLLAGLASLAVAQWAATHSPAAAFYLLPTRGWELLLGALVAIHYAGRHPATADPAAAAPVSRQVASLLGLGLIYFAVFHFDQNTPFPGIPALLPTIGTALIILFADRQTWVGKLLGSPLMVGIGLVSYSAYLWHQPLFAFARHALGPAVGAPAMLLLSGLAIGLAYLSWKYVEMPFRNRQKITRRPVFVGAVAGSLAFLGLGLLGHFSLGFSNRYPPEDRYLAELNFADAGKYVGTRFDQLHLHPFASAGKTKVMIVGDSYAQDLVNALAESGVGDGLQLSTFHIAKECGNLYLEKDFSANISKANIDHCRELGWYENSRLRAQLQEADAIWLVSAWQYWQAELLPESVRNLEKAFGPKVLVFGRKNFGSFTIKDLLASGVPERYALSRPMSDEHLRTNALMRAALPANVFVDVSTALCGEQSVCPLFTTTGQLISYDGGHLTPAGARYCGERLSRHPLIRQFMSSPSNSGKVIRAGEFLPLPVNK